MHGGHLLKAYAKTQANIALSSGEAEYYSMVRAASEAMGMQAMARDFQKDISPWLYVDATAALGVAQRIGLGKVRHLETQSLWLQQAVRQRRLGLAKVLGTLNPADAMTKALDSHTLERLVGLMGLEMREGRAAIAPHIEKVDVCAVESEEAERIVQQKCNFKRTQITPAHVPHEDRLAHAPHEDLERQSSNPSTRTCRTSRAVPSVHSSWVAGARISVWDEEAEQILLELEAAENVQEDEPNNDMNNFDGQQVDMRDEPNDESEVDGLAVDSRMHT